MCGSHFNRAWQGWHGDFSGDDGGDQGGAALFQQGNRPLILPFWLLSPPGGAIRASILAKLSRRARGAQGARSKAQGARRSTQRAVRQPHPPKFRAKRVA